MVKLVTEITDDVIELKIKSANYKETIVVIQMNKACIENGSQTLEFALSELNAIMTNIKRNKIAISLSDEMFKMTSVEQFKTTVTKLAKSFQLHIYKPPRFISTEEEIANILHDFHKSPIGGHIGRHRLYLKLRYSY